MCYIICQCFVALVVLLFSCVFGSVFIPFGRSVDRLFGRSVLSSIVIRIGARAFAQETFTKGYLKSVLELQQEYRHPIPGGFSVIREDLFFLT